MLPLLKRKGKDNEKLIKSESTKKLLARYSILYGSIDYIYITNITIMYFKFVILYRCYLKLGCWQEELQGLTDLSIPNVLEYYSAAKYYDPSWYKAWHSWAYMNFETVLFYKHQQNNTHSSEQNTEKGATIKASPEVFKLIFCFTILC